MILSATLLKRITQGEWLHQAFEKDVPLLGGAFDTRDIEDQEIFFAWQGEKQNGHDFLDQLSNTTIKVVLVEHDVSIFDQNISILKVNSSLRALHQLAEYVRICFRGKVIAITGSSGKTTMKTWLSTIVSKRYNVLSSKKSFNNNIGCPITMLSVTKKHKLLILEIGTSQIGEINFLSSIVKPHIAVLLNVGTAHIGKLGSQENIYKAKLEIFNHLERNGVAILPADDPKLKINLPFKKIFFGRNSEHFSWQRLDNGGDAFKQKIRFQIDKMQLISDIDLIGEHIPQTLSAIIAVCCQLQFSASYIISRLQNLENLAGRMKLIRGFNRVSIIDDTYNANPDSVMNLLSTMSLLPFKHKILILGELSEQDKKLEIFSKKLGENIPQFLDDVYLFGKNTTALNQVFNLNKIKSKIFKSNDLEKLFDALKPKLNDKSLIGIKGSRVAKTEQILQLLKAVPHLKSQ